MSTSSPLKRRNLTRNSGVELLKLIAIFLIVINHVVRGLRLESAGLYSHEYLLDFAPASGDLSSIVLQLFSYFGALGNTIFFVCSAWFLLRSSHFSKRKWFGMLFEVWFISVFILAVVFFVRRGDVSGKILLSSLLPSTFANNWYITCYLLFYPIHPLLNTVIHKLSQRQLLRTASVMFLLYCCFAFVKEDLFFPSTLILWITIYFVIAYLQLYMDDFVNSRGKNLVLLAVGLIGYIGMVVCIDLLGLRISFLQDKPLFGAVNCNPFLIIVSIALFNLMRRWNFKNKAINYTASLSLLIYIIHENIVLRTYYRPLMWKYIYEHYGYEHILLWVFVMALVTLTFGVVCAAVYDVSLRRLITIVGNRIYSLIRKVMLKVETLLLRAH